MFANRNLTLFTLTFMCLILESYDLFTNDDKPCYIQPLIDIANKTVYFGINFKVNFFEAANFCRAHCMHLISIENEQEQKAIAKYLGETPYRGEFMWTSGNDLAKEGEFTWLSTGKRISYTNWFPGEPSNKSMQKHSENCLGLFFDYTWNDFTCDKQFFFICEIRQ